MNFTCSGCGHSMWNPEDPEVHADGCPNMAVLKSYAAIAFGKDNYAVNPEYVAWAEEIGTWPAKINFLPEPYSGDAGDETE